MPIIPFLDQTQATPNIPNAVLDHNRRPQVNPSGVLSAIGALADAQKQPLIDGKAMAAPYEALGSVGEAIMRTGSVLGAAALKQQETENTVQVNRAQTALAAKRQEFEIYQQENRDPLQWKDKWDEMTGPVKEQLLSDPKLQPEARDKISELYDSWHTLHTNDVVLQQRKATNAEAAQGYNETLQSAVLNQDAKTFDETFNKGVAEHFLYPNSKPIWDKKFQDEGERLRAKSQADSFNAVQNDVVGTTSTEGLKSGMDRLKTYTGLAPDDRAKLAKRITDVSELWSKNASADLTDGIATGAIDSEARLAQAMKQTGVEAHVSPALFEKLKGEVRTQDFINNQRWREGDSAEAPGLTNGMVSAAQIRQSILHDYDPATDKEGTGVSKYVSWIRTSAEKDEQPELIALIRDKAGISAKAQEESKQIWNKIGDAKFDAQVGVLPWEKRVPRIEKEKDVTHHFFSPNETTYKPVIDPSTGKAKVLLDKNGDPRTDHLEDPFSRQQAAVERAKIDQHMRLWAELNPDKAKDPRAVEAEYNKQIPGAVLGSALQKLLPSNPDPKGTPQDNSLFNH